VRAFCAALLALFLCGAAPAEKPEVETREFSSANRAFILKAAYSGKGGWGSARLELYGASGKKISSFEAESPPFTVAVSGDGRRLIFFCGSWGQAVNIYTLKVHAASGELLATHKLEMSGPAGEDFSADSSVYAVAADQGDKRVILVLDSATGKALWRKSFKEKLAGLKLSPSGDRLLAIFPSAGGSRASVFDRKGAELGSVTVKTGNSLVPRGFTGGGSGFELWEEGTVYDEKDGYWHAKLLKKRYYGLTSSGVKETSVKEVNEYLK
jgi:hypothetical protein